MFEHVARSKMPVGWFALFLLIWITISIYSFYEHSAYINKLDAFMAKESCLVA
jgi:hypothetical protein